jgi:hypothetical protein
MEIPLITKALTKEELTFYKNIQTYYSIPINYWCINLTIQVQGYPKLEIIKGARSRLMPDLSSEARFAFLSKKKPRKYRSGYLGFTRLLQV